MTSDGRRSFLTKVASIAGVVALDGAFSRASAQAQAQAGAAAKFDLTWMEQLKGRHKQALDYGSFDLSADGRPLRFVRNYLDPFRDVLGLQFPEVNTSVGISRDAFPINASDAIWAKYKLGERWKIIDPTTKQPAVRNIYLTDGGDISMKALQARGTVFWQCNIALGAIVQELAQATQMPPEKVRAELIEGFVPGVRLVPSHMMALGLMQERGFTYTKP
jgi:hypothetical protein